MKRIAKCLVLAITAAALLLAMLPSMPAAAAEGEAIRYTVTVTGDGAIVTVNMEFQATEEVAVLRPSLPGILPDNYFQIVEATSDSGGSVPVSRNGSVWTIYGRGRLNIVYTADLDSLAGASSTSAGARPQQGEGYIFMPGSYLLLQPDSPGPENVSFNLPEGWEAWSSWDGRTSSGTVASRGGFFAGTATALETTGDFPLTVVQAGSADPANLAAQPEFAEKLSAQIGSAYQAWGKPEMGGERLLVFLGGIEQETVDNNQLLSEARDSYNNCAFVPVGRQENILSTDFLLRAGDESMRVLLGAMKLEPSAWWFREGCIHYSNLRFAQGNQWISEDGVYDRLGTAYASYVDALAQSETSLAGAGEQALQEPAADLLYAGGTIAVTSIDVRLAEKDRSLDGFIASLLQNTSGEIITNQYLQDQFETYSGVSFDSFFKEYVNGTGTIPASSFSQLKLDRETAVAGTENPIQPAPGFGTRWIMIVVAIGIVFALPFVLEPYTLRPRGGAEALSEDEEAERVEGSGGKRRWWSWDEINEDDDEDDSGAEDEDEPVGENGEEPGVETEPQAELEAELEAKPRPEGYEFSDLKHPAAEEDAPL